MSPRLLSWRRRRSTCRPSDEKAWKSYGRPGRRPKSSQDVQRCSSEVPGGRSRIVDWGRRGSGLTTSCTPTGSSCPCLGESAGLRRRLPAASAGEMARDVLPGRLASSTLCVQCDPVAGDVLETRCPGYATRSFSGLVGETGRRSRRADRGLQADPWSEGDRGAWVEVGRERRWKSRIWFQRARESHRAWTRDRRLGVRACHPRRCPGAARCRARVVTFGHGCPAASPRGVGCWHPRLLLRRSSRVPQRARWVSGGERLVRTSKQVCDLIAGGPSHPRQASAGGRRRVLGSGASIASLSSSRTRWRSSRPSWLSSRWASAPSRR